MWLLKSKHERNGPISICLPLGQYSIGRIECSFNITDDKSVSRKHALFEVKSASEVLLSDCGSKFGTWLNGERLEAAQMIKDGDSIKFGGLESEFTIVNFQVCAFIGELASLNDRNHLATLSHKFSFSLSSDLLSPAWNFCVLPDTITAASPALLCALARSAALVRSEFFLRLSDPNPSHQHFSEALLQPQCLPFAPKFLLPRQGRCEAFASALNGVRNLICLRKEDFSLLKPLEQYFQFTVQHQSLEECRNVPFCDLIVCGGREEREALRVRQLTRLVAIESLVDAFIQGNESLICIENVYPLVGGEVEDEKGLHEAEDVKMNPITMTDAMTDSNKPSVIPIPFADSMANASKQIPLANANKPTVLTECKTSAQPTPILSSSPVILQPIPPSLLRSSQPQPQPQPSAQSSKTKFIKCHPLTRQPHSIPLLYGPHQLQSTAAPINAGAGAGGAGRKRVLVRDEWLAEDDFVGDGSGIRIGSIGGNGTSRIAGNRNGIGIGIGTGTGNGTGIASSTSTSHTPASSTSTSHTTQSTTAIPSTTTSQTTQTTQSTQTTSKFQSSFFQNLQKKT